MIPIKPEVQKLLSDMGFISNVPGLYQKDADEQTIAYIDFRKVDGRRFAKRNNEFVDDEDTIDILKQFKEERLKLDPEKAFNQLQSSKGDTDKQPSSEEHDGMGKDKPVSPIVSPQEVKTLPSPTFNLYEFFHSLVGAGGIIEIFGDTGSLKSQLCTEVCKDARKLGKEFFYLDTEGKVGLMNKKELGASYRYLPVWDEIVKLLKSGVPKNSLLVVDSIGFPISTEYADMKANEQGETLQEMMAVVGKYLKVWAFRNGSIVIFTNQPKSSFMKSEEEINRLDPFGDKVHFAANIILRTKKAIIPGHFDTAAKKIIPPISIATFTSHRSTDFMDDVVMFVIKKNDDELKIEVPPHVTKRLLEITDAGTKITR